MLNHLFYVDRLSYIMLFVIAVVGASVFSFSKRYISGDRLYHRFLFRITALIVCIAFIQITDHVILFLIFFGLGNIFLIQLMIHKKSWIAAQQSGLIAKKYLAFGWTMIASGLCVLACAAHTTSMHHIVHAHYQMCTLNCALIAVLLGAMVQSAIWPFHQWLLGSLNSPTPVSAVMHAGLVNGGGLLLIKCAVLYAHSPIILECVFVIGFVTAVIGTLWKLIQHDIKKMLACSTMGQMGFMFVQCGLGFFPAALAHLCAHSFFKAHLFLASGSASEEKRMDTIGSINNLHVLLALVCGAIGMLIFMYTTDHGINHLDAGLVLSIFVFMANAQLAITLISSGTPMMMIYAVLWVLVFSFVYGTCMRGMEYIMQPMDLLHAQSLSWIHMMGIVCVIFMWLIMRYTHNLKNMMNRYRILQKFYVSILNGSQPHPKTITAHKQNYTY